MSNTSEYVAYSEVYEILRNTPEELVKKIPQNLIKKIGENRNSNYQFIYNKDEALSKQNISDKAKAILAVLFCDYIADEDERKEEIKIFNDNEKKYQQSLSEKYDVNKTFERNKNIGMNDIEVTEEGPNQVRISTGDKEIVLYKETFFTKLQRFFKGLFKSNQKSKHVK